MTRLTQQVCLPVMFGFCLAAIGSGCGGSGGATEFTTGSVRVKVLPPPAVAAYSSGSSKGDYSWTSFEWRGTTRKSLTVVVDHLRLEVNGQDYGRLAAGDEVVIDARHFDPTVAVNGADGRRAGVRRPETTSTRS